MGESEHDLELMHHTDMVSVRHEIASLDKRAAVLEARVDELKLGHSQLRLDIANSGRDIEAAISKVMSVLEEHIATEQRDRVQLLWAGLSALAAALSTLTMWAAPKLWGILTYTIPTP